MPRRWIRGKRWRRFPALWFWFLRTSQLLPCSLAVIVGYLSTLSARSFFFVNLLYSLWCPTHLDDCFALGLATPLAPVVRLLELPVAMFLAPLVARLLEPPYSLGKGDHTIHPFAAPQSRTIRSATPCSRTFRSDRESSQSRNLVYYCEHQLIYVK